MTVDKALDIETLEKAIFAIQEKIKKYNGSFTVKMSSRAVGENVVFVYSVKISIIVPVFNNEKYLDRSIKSLINQTFKDIEIICVDDASTDNSLNILNKYKMIDNRIKVIHLDINKGPSIARNTGINLAVGNFIGFTDSDDYVDKEFFENLYKYSEGNDIIEGIFVDSTNNSDNYVHHKKFTSPQGYVYDSIFRRKFLDDNNIRFPTNIRIEEDQLFRISCYKLNPKIVNTPDVGIYYYYKRREGSLWKKSKRHLARIDRRAKIEEKKRRKIKKTEII
ncbi:nucleotide-diphospho-sugar transferase [Piromyces finnis]|uniref:Nucleotide-diphospho-sugar transferase n=1 Tax=Piromyces finnis TaxID=1754191 RepID=A0A1Y1UX62_9FUNG|nr:nucleotide-diphospho-sugar transferase [Piromyces finnis]|eukprot:ORX42257.1 nucleotide-diphospho-sugar transferase [Piromyces finnis]